MTNVFVVDDSISVRKALEMALKKEGMSVRSASSAEQALEQLGDEPFDLLIADVIMPGQSGFDLCRQLKATPEYGHLPVLIISGNVDAEVKHEAHEAGAVGVLKKPFRQEELMPAVEHALKQVGTPAAAVPAAAPAPVPTLSDQDLEVPVSPVTTAPTIAPAPVSPYAALADRAASAPGVLGLVVLDTDGTVLERRGQALPPSIGLYARFYMGTADALGRQMREGEATEVNIELGSKRLLIRGLADKLVVSLNRL